MSENGHLWYFAQYLKNAVALCYYCTYDKIRPAGKLCVYFDYFFRLAPPPPDLGDPGEQCEEGDGQGSPPPLHSSPGSLSHQLVILTQWDPIPPPPLSPYGPKGEKWLEQVWAVCVCVGQDGAKVPVPGEGLQVSLRAAHDGLRAPVPHLWYDTHHQGNRNHR